MRRLVGVVMLGALVVGLVGVQSAGAGLGSDDDDHPVGYTISTQGRGVPRGGCDFFKVDLTTGAATQVNPASVDVACGDGLTFDDDGTLYAYVTPPTTGPVPVTQLVTIDLDDGSQHVVGNLPNAFVGSGGMTFDEDGDLWLYAFAVNSPPCTTATSCLWKVNPKTAATTFVGSAPPERAVYGLTADCEDVLAISAIAPAGTSFNVALDEVHTSSAALERIVDLPGFGFPTGLDFEDDGDLWALAFSGRGLGAGIGMSVYRIDPTDGTFQTKDITVGGAPFVGQMNGLAVDPIECTEPVPPAPPAPPTPVAVAPVFTG
jgi:hypothetical protein